MKPRHKHVSLFTIPDSSMKDIDTVVSLDQEVTDDLFSEYLKNFNDDAQASSNEFKENLKKIARYSSQAAYAELLQRTIKLSLVESNTRKIAQALGVKYEYASLLVRAAKKIITNSINADDLQSHVGRSVAITDNVLSDLASLYSTEKTLKAKLGIAGAISETVKTKDKLLGTVSKLGLGSIQEESKDKKVLNDLRNSFADLLNLDED